MTLDAILERTEAVRRFNRFYTQQIGVLEEGFLRSPFSLAEVRVLYEIAHHEETTASKLGQELGMDAGYLSRILKGFERRGLVERTPSKRDRRRTLLTLSNEGECEFSKLNGTQRRAIEAMLERISDRNQHRLIRSMETIELLLGARPEQKAPYILRPHQSGDLGWIVHRHGGLYNQEYGWNEEFEALCAEIVAQFVRTYDRYRERCWIAERDGENVGSALLVRHPEREDVAKLRLLLVEPKARGLGIGRRLVQECGRFARQARYRTITLWTNSVLVSARRIYEAEGYRLIDEAAHHSFGADLVGQTWELDLAADPPVGAPGMGH